MFARFFQRSNSSDVPQELYGSVVTQARQTAFFTHFGFEDTVTGRYDLVALHLFIFSRRLVREDKPLAQSLNQEVFDRFTDETDRALRELGVGDTSVPKRKKRLIHSFYAIVEELSELMDAEDENGLAVALQTRFAPKKTGDFKANVLGVYVLEAARKLDAQSTDRIMTGLLEWPNPQEYL